MSLVFYRFDQRGKGTMYIMFYMSVLPVLEGFRSHFEYPCVVFLAVGILSLALVFFEFCSVLKCLLFLNIIIMCVD
jgi:hypothetical protein